MEWLINRRRMMYNRATTPAYIPFEDIRVWTACCNAWGDHNKTVITDNGNSTVNIVTTFESMLNTTLKKSIAIDSQTNVDNTGGTYVAGTTYEPVGITEKQCNAVTGLSTNLRNLGTDLNFKEFRYFTKITNINSGTPFQNDQFVKIKFPTSITNISCYSPFYKDCAVLDFPAGASITSFYGSNLTGVDVLIVRNSTLQSAYYISRLKSTVEIYVPEDLVDSYKVASNWSDRASRIFAIEGSDYEVFNAWEYND